ncbi:MAG TPA: PIN domain-containing protein [Verrucomicrobiales bacterium]|nr:PIN domain-containing protein [Verrucomicrobiales bacterium]
MTVFADSSFLLSLVIRDANSRAARRWWQRRNEPLCASPLVLFECENGLRSLHLRGGLSEEEAATAKLLLEKFVSEGVVAIREVRLKLLMAEARRLLIHFARPVVHGSLDVLHVAAARVLRAETLVSFDDNQRGLAADAGFRVAP